MISNILFATELTTPGVAFEWFARTKYRFVDISEMSETLPPLRMRNTAALVFEMEKPDMASLNSLKALKNRFGADLPVIAIAGDNSFEMECDLRRVGIYHYLLKPFQHSDLCAILDAAICYSRQILPELSFKTVFATYSGPQGVIV